MIHWLWVALRTFLQLDALLWLIVTALGIWLLGLRAGARYSWAQLIGTCIATPVGWVVMIVPCAMHAWRMQGLVSTKDGRPIDSWIWPWLQKLAGNIEDSASGTQALVHEAGVLVPYMPMPSWAKRWRWSIWLWQSLRAYLWSAWRNSADGLKYLLAWADAPPLVVRAFGPVTVKVGWMQQDWGRRANVPVLSAWRTAPAS